MLPRNMAGLVLMVLVASSTAAGLSGCRGAGQFLGNLLRERPPAPLDSMSLASDVRIDSFGYVMGSFVGEGTSRAVHLVSSDTGLVAELARRFRPDLVQSGEVWQRLARAQTVTLAPTGGGRRTVAGTPKIEQAL